MTGYTETILQWADDSRRAGPLDDPHGVGEVGLDGEQVGKRLAVRFAIRVSDNSVETVRFQVFGCGFTIAACAAGADLAEGKSLEEAASIDAEMIDGILGGLPEERDYCAKLAAEALKGAIAGAREGASEAKRVVHVAQEESDHGARLDSSHPLYRKLMDSPFPSGVDEKDRHLFACLLTMATEENHPTAEALGLEEEGLAGLLETYFPAITPEELEKESPAELTPPPEINEEILRILLSHVPKTSEEGRISSPCWLAHCLAARAAHPGHLWTAMGLFERPELTAAIRRNLPSLAEANNKGMRWKRYLFKQLCDMSGAVLCKAPNCGVCSDYAICFAPEEE